MMKSVHLGWPYFDSARRPINAAWAEAARAVMKRLEVLMVQLGMDAYVNCRSKAGSSNLYRDNYEAIC
jgi:hypothetical protein